MRVTATLSTARSTARRVGGAAAAGVRRGRRGLALLLLVAACGGIVLVAKPSSAAAPELVSSSPVDGEIVRSTDEVRLTFDQPVAAELATIRMTNPSGEQVVAGRPYNPGGDRRTIAVPMPRTRYAGTYLVAWVVPSSRLEPIGGTLAFAVFQPTDPVRGPVLRTDRDSTVVAVHTVARLVAIAGFALGVGVCLVLALAWPAGGGRRWARRLVVAGWCALVLGTAATFLSFGGYAAWTSSGDAFDPALLRGTLRSDAGAALVARLLVLVPVTVALVLLRSLVPVETMLRTRAARKAAAAKAAAATGAAHWPAAAAVVGVGAALAASVSLARARAPGEPTLGTLAVESFVLLALALGVGGVAVLSVVWRAADAPARPIVVARLARALPVCAALLAISAALTPGRRAYLLAGLAFVVVAAAAAARRWTRQAQVSATEPEPEADADSQPHPGRLRRRQPLAGAASSGRAAARR